MRDRLIELITESGCVDTWNYHTDDFKKPNPIDKLADYLLANGVIVPPCKVGDTVYIPWHYNGVKGVAFVEVTHIIIHEKRSYIKTNLETDDEGFWEHCGGAEFEFADFGKTVFLTREEAEAKLKGGEG